MQKHALWTLSTYGNSLEWRLAGHDQSGLRQILVEAITGKEEPKSKCGLTRLMELIRHDIGIKSTDYDTIAARDVATVERIKELQAKADEDEKRPKTETETYKEPMDKAEAAFRFDGKDPMECPYRFSSNNADVYWITAFLLYWTGKRPEKIHKSRGNLWIIDGRKTTVNKPDHRRGIEMEGFETTEEREAEQAPKMETSETAQTELF